MSDKEYTTLTHETTHKLNELRQKSAKEYKGRISEDIEKVCHNMSVLANNDKQTYKTKFNSATFYVHPGENPAKALHNWAEAYWKDTPQETLFANLKKYNENTPYISDNAQGMLASVLVEKIITDYPEKAEEISPLLMLNAHWHNDGSFADGKYFAQTKALLDKKVDAYIAGVENVPLTMENIKKLRNLATYANFAIDADGKPRMDVISKERREKTEKAYLERVANGLLEHAKDKVEFLSPNEALDTYDLAKKHDDVRTMDMIAGSFRTTEILNAFGFDHFDVMGVDKNSGEFDMLKRSINFLMNGFDTIKPESPRHIREASRLCRFMEKEMRNTEAVNKRFEEIETAYLDRLQKDPSQMKDFSLADYRTIRDTITDNYDPENPKYDGLTQKINTEIARLWKIEEAKSKGPNG